MWYSRMSCSPRAPSWSLVRWVCTSYIGASFNACVSSWVNASTLMDGPPSVDQGLVDTDCGTYPLWWTRDETGEFPCTRLDQLVTATTHEIKRTRLAGNPLLGEPGRGCGQPFTDPDMSPPMKYRPRTRYTTRVGAEASSAPAIDDP